MTRDTPAVGPADRGFDFHQHGRQRGTPRPQNLRAFDCRPLGTGTHCVCSVLPFSKTNFSCSAVIPLLSSLTDIFSFDCVIVSSLEYSLREPDNQESGLDTLDFRLLPQEPTTAARFTGSQLTPLPLLRQPGRVSVTLTVRRWKFRRLGDDPNTPSSSGPQFALRYHTPARNTTVRRSNPCRFFPPS